MVSRAPKQWALGKQETVTTFNAWKDNLLYILSLESKFALYLQPDAQWAKYTTTNPNRGYTDDAGASSTPPTGLKKEEKVKNLQLFLGQIANYATIISRNQIVRNSTSLKDIFSKLREHYGLQTSGSKFIDLINIRLNPGERYEDLYQRLLAFYEDNLLTSGDSITHHGEQITSNEELTPSLENMVVLLWLERIHTSLPGLIKQKYGSELRNKTLASLKSEISQSLDSLLEELKGSEDGCNKVLRVNTSYPRRSNGSSQQQSSQQQRTPFCCLCHAAKRPSTNHWLSKCSFLPASDKRMFQSRNRVRAIGIENQEDADEIADVYDDEEEDTADNSCFIDPPIHRRVTTRRSPHLVCFIGQMSVRVCLDSGAESNLVSKRFTIDANVSTKRASQGAVQADSRSPLNIVGEISNVTLVRGSHSFVLDALVTEKDFGDYIIAGEPFLEKNDIALRASKKQIIIKGRDIVPYDTQ